ncbi:MAG: hypothetical protein ACREMW_13690 [Gemmatimonadales bacterium]
MTATPMVRRLIAKAWARVRPLSLVAALSLLGCYTEAVHVPAELAPAARLPVKGRSGWGPGHRLRFGEYETERRESRLLQAVIGIVADVVRGEGIEPLGFRLRTSGRDAWRADCDPITRHRQGEPPSTESNHLRCTLVPAAGDSSRAWRLLVHQAYPEAPSGDLIGPEGRLVIAGTTRNSEGRVHTADHVMGYYVQDGGRTVATVEVVFEGAVWFHPELSPQRRDLLAATAAALLLWDYLVNTPL